VDQRYVEDASGFRGSADRVFAPQSCEEIAAIVTEAVSRRIAITVAGAGTGVTGGRCAQGGWVIATEKLDKMGISPGVAVVGAGVALRDLQAAAAASGQFYPPDPTEWTASVGGTIATNASGSRSLRYGATRRYVRAVTAVMMDGSVRRFTRRQAVDFAVPALPIPATTKNTAGYLLWPGMDWIDLLVGSEGTLAIVTEADLQLLPRPAFLLSGTAFFPDDEAAVKAVAAWRPVPGLRMLEYMDAGSLDLLRQRFPEIPSRAGAALLYEQEAGQDEVDAWVERLEASRADAEASWFAAGDKDRERFRQFRHALPELVNDRARRNGFLKLGSDYAVPFERNLEMLRHYRAMLEPAFPGRYVIFGHIGDAHVHVNILPTSQQEFDRGRELMIELARRVVELGGTVSAEHGLGKSKRALLEIQYKAAELDAMRAVKCRLDPLWLLGRGNLFPEPVDGFHA
jgi:FAD/FMN-containing dehydrogenase